MTTVSDPNGTPAPVYNRSGTTIALLTASGTTQGNGAQILRKAGVTVVMMSNSNAPFDAAVMPTDAEIGDLVEVHMTGYTVALFPESGAHFDGESANAVLDIDPRCSIFRKTDSTTWTRIIQSS